MRSIPIVILLLLCGLATVPAMASRQEDSAHADVEGAVTSAERARAILAIAAAQAKAQPGESLTKVTMAVSFAERSGDQPLLLRALRQQRELEHRAGAYDQFLVSAIRIVGISERYSDARGLAEDLRSLCEAYERIGAFDKAIEFRRQALFLLKSTGDSAEMGKGIVDLINSLVLAGRFSEVLQQSENAIAYYSAHDNPSGLASVWLGQGEALIAQRKYSAALPILTRANDVLGKIHDPVLASRALRDLAEANIALSDWANARNYLDQAFKLSQDHSELPKDPKLFALMSRVYEGTGELSGALAMHRAHAALKDSLFNERMAERMVGLQALYSNQRKNEELDSMRLRAEANEESATHERATGRFWILGFIVLLIIVSGLIMMVRRMRKLTRRTLLKNQVVLRQTEELKAKSMELERQNLRLAESLVNEDQKDVQLKEIHHRVKNNLQIVNTLLKMQGTYIDNDALQEVLSDCQGRVRSMALVHEHIYRCGDLNRINVKAHTLALGEAVLKNYGLAGKVSLDLTVTYDHAHLEDLIPLSLLLNELITNSAKHAFKDRDQGRITIIMRRMGENQCELLFSDDGVGMGHEQFFNSDSFGSELVRTLATQLDGRIRLLRGEGTTFQLTFDVQDHTLRKAS